MTSLFPCHSFRHGWRSLQTYLAGSEVYQALRKDQQAYLPAKHHQPLARQLAPSGCRQGVQVLGYTSGSLQFVLVEVEPVLRTSTALFCTCRYDAPRSTLGRHGNGHCPCSTSSIPTEITPNSIRPKPRLPPRYLWWEMRLV